MTSPPRPYKAAALVVWDGRQVHIHLQPAGDLTELERVHFSMDLRKSASRLLSEATLPFEPQERRMFEKLSRGGVPQLKPKKAST